MDWDDLRFFLAVGQGGSTAAGARALRVNQSTVVRRVAALEKVLGLRLFDKRRDGYRLTAEGSALVEAAAAVEASALDFTRRAASLNSALTGTLRVTTAEGIALGLMPPLLSEFHRRYPGMQVNLLIEDAYRQPGDGEADLALRSGSPGEGPLIGRKLSDQCWAVYGSRDYIHRHGCPAAPRDLNKHLLVGFGSALDRIMPARWLQATAPGAQIACRSNSILGMLFAAQSGFGLALLPCHIGDPEPDVIRVIDPLPTLTDGFWILTHADLHKSAKVRAFFDFMVERIDAYKPLLLGLTKPVRTEAGAGPQVPGAPRAAAPKLPQTLDASRKHK